MSSARDYESYRGRSIRIANPAKRKNIERAHRLLPIPVPGSVVSGTGRVVSDDGMVEVVVGRTVVAVGRTVVAVARAVVVVTGACTQDGSVKVFVSRVTAPFRARSRPSMRAFVVAEIDVSASIDPLNRELVPSVAELPTCQNTRQAFAPFVRIIVLDDAVINVEFV